MQMKALTDTTLYINIPYSDMNARPSRYAFVMISGGINMVWVTKEIMRYMYDTKVS